jgi:hypothetical protein
MRKSPDRRLNAVRFNTEDFARKRSVDPLILAITVLRRADWSAVKLGNKLPSKCKARSGSVVATQTRSDFQFVDTDVVYRTSEPDTLTIVSYRFSTGIEPIK